MYSTDNYYKILDIPQTASPEEIKKAFRRQAKKFHPDFNVNNRTFAEQAMKRINSAYEVLGNPQKRCEYDKSLLRAEKEKLRNARKAPTRKPDRDFSDEITRRVNEAVRRKAEAKRQREQKEKKRGTDISVSIRISLEDAFKGIRGKVGYSRMRRCASCRGTGKLFGRTCSRCCGKGVVTEKHTIEKNIPRGVYEGCKLRSAEDGNEGKKRNCFGDLFVYVHIHGHSRFTRSGDDLIHSVKLSRKEFLAGTEIEILTIDGKTLRVAIPAGTQNGTLLRIRGFGMPQLASGKRGNLLIRVLKP